ncbi:hypothetical protein QN277_000403 [Acacia crassicarpa]|uniref:Mechanosensitive ion channel protein n=1 Tax=Acacia crassicarpa TaxID=499986 RepID=A0AAE1N509_9FABA|nr:hypothetical protein QN277_000403 [Acacia crassicarpa]
MEKKTSENEVVLQIQEKEEASSYTTKKESQMDSSPEIRNVSPSSGKPPKIPTETLIKRRSLSRSEFSKPKSRLLEPPYQADPKFLEAKSQKESYDSSSNRNSPNVTSPMNKNTKTPPRSNPSTAPETPGTPLKGKEGEDEEEEDDEDEQVYKTADLEVSKRSGKKKLKLMALIERSVFLCVIAALISSLTIHKLQNMVIWSLNLWKWCVLVFVIICGRIITEWFINILVFLFERNLVFKRKVLYFVYGLKKSVQAFIWLALVLLTWFLLFNHGVKRSRRARKILNYITGALASCLIGAGIWLVKNLFTKLLASSFQCSRFFDRIQESIIHQYIVRILSGPPLMEMAEMVGKSGGTGQLSLRILNKEKKGEKEEVIDVDKLKNMKQDKVSAWTMKGLVNVIRSSGLSTIRNTLESYIDDDEEAEQKEMEINSEWEAKAAAYRIFKNVAMPGNKYIEEEDLLRFMKKEEAENVLPLIEGAAETGKIKRKSLKNWLVKVYLERKSLVHSLNDTKTAVDELNNLVSVVVLIIIIIVWLLLMGFLTTQVILFISSQLLLSVFIFGNAAKTLFEGIIFVFVMHPFDVGDRCVIDGVQMTVEEMNILTTVFLRYDNEKIFYPNSVLATKPISNYYRSPDMIDSVEFAVDIATSMETIGALKASIKAYLEGKPQHWRAGHSVVVKKIENVNKMNMALYVTHTINFQNYGEKSSRRSELVLELKRIFQNLNITYHLLPQDVHLSYVGPEAPCTVWK